MTKKHRKPKNEKPSRTRIALGNAIQLWRKERKMTQSALAKAVGKSVPTISKIESGLHPLDIDMVERIAKHLNVSASRLIWEFEKEKLEKQEGGDVIVPIFENLLGSLDRAGVKL